MNNCKSCKKQIRFWQRKLQHPKDKSMIWHESFYKQNYPFAMYVAFKSMLTLGEPGQ